MSETTNIKFYLDQLKSEECICGRTKKRKKSFCYKCYKSLPYELQRGLWRKLRDGYEESYEEAVEYLKED